MCKNALSLKFRVFSMYKLYLNERNMKGLAAFRHQRVKEWRDSSSLPKGVLPLETTDVGASPAALRRCCGVSEGRAVG